MVHEKRGPLCSAPTFAAVFLGLGSPCPVGGSCVASAKLGPWVKGPVLCQVLGSDGSLSLASLPANARSPRTLSPRSWRSSSPTAGRNRSRTPDHFLRLPCVAAFCSEGSPGRAPQPQGSAAGHAPAAHFRTASVRAWPCPSPP